MGKANRCKQEHTEMLSKMCRNIRRAGSGRQPLRCRTEWRVGSVSGLPSSVTEAAVGLVRGSKAILSSTVGVNNGSQSLDSRASAYLAPDTRSDDRAPLPPPFLPAKMKNNASTQALLSSRNRWC